MSCDRYKDHEGVWCGDPFCVLIIPRLRGTPQSVLFDEESEGSSSEDREEVLV